jgi:hypothetical protein
VITSGEIPLNKDLIFDGGAGARPVIQSSTGRIFRIYNGVVVFNNLRFEGGPSFGGGIVNQGTTSGDSVTITNSVFNSSHTTGAGGAIENSGVMTISGSTFEFNSAVDAGGAIANSGTLTLTGSRLQYNSSATSGGSVANTTGTLTIDGSLIADSNASAGAGGGLLVTGGTATVTNSTFSFNKAEDATTGGGGGIAASGATTTVDLVHTTMVGNIAASAATAFGGGGIMSDGANVTLRGTMLTGNTESGGAASDLAGSFTSNGYNLIRTIPLGFTPAATDITAQDPLLGAIDVYGAPNDLRSFPLLPGSPAIDAAVCPAGVTLDQRGITRGTTGATPCDIGAFESRGFDVVTVSGAPQSANVNTAFAAPLVVTVSSANNEPVVGGVVRFAGPETGASTDPAVTTATIMADGSATVNVTANSAGGVYAVNAGGNGIATVASFSLTNLGPGYGSTPAPGSTIDTGLAVIGTPVDAPALLSISETGDLALNVTGATISGPNAADFSVTPTTLTIPNGGAAQNLSISCTPSAAGTRTATLTVSHNAGAPATYALTCAGTLAPAPGYGSVPAPGSTLDLGITPIGTAASATIIVSEIGTAVLNVTGVSISGPDAADFSVTPTTLTIANGGTAQSLTVSCTPSALGVRTATLSVTHNAASSPALYTLTCTSAGRYLPFVWR